MTRILPAPGSMFAALALGLLLCAGVQASRAQASAPPLTPRPATVSLGVLATDTAAALPQWQPLADYLNRTLPEVHFELHVYNDAQQEEAIRRHDVDVLVTQPTDYVRLVHQEGLSSPLATLIGLERGQPVRAVGGVIVVSRDNPGALGLKDLQGKRVAAPDLRAFNGYQAQMAELQREGIQPGRVVETGWPAQQGVEAVLHQRADAAFLPAGLPEQLVRNGTLANDALVVLHPQEYPGYPVALSTRLYPQWPVVAMPYFNDALAARIAGALLSVPQGSELARSIGLYGFSTPADYEPVRDMMRSLREPPFDHDDSLGWHAFWNEYRTVVLTGLLLVISLLAFAVREIILRRRLSSFSNAMGEGMFVLDRRGHVSYINRAACALLDYPRDALMGRPLLQLILPPGAAQGVPDPGGSPGPQGAIGAARWQQPFEGEAIFITSTGHVFPVEINNTPVRRKGRFLRSVTVFSDISERKAQDAHVRHLAYHDSLTALPNRRYLLERLQERLASRPGAAQGALLFSDLDRFKLLNDTLGHQTGDALLQAAAERLRRRVGSHGLVARIGGDEFAVLLERLAEDPVQARQQVLELAEQILVAMREPFSIGPQYHRTSVSIGAALFDGPELSPDELLKRADLAMYEAKAAGRNAIRLFDRDVAEQLRARVALEKDLQQALTQQQFRLHYQPQFDGSGRLVGAEALVRWEHPERGLVPPGEFIPLAEESGLILPLGLWILETACVQIEKWRDHPELGQIVVSVNICAHQMVQANFVESVLAVLMATQANPQRLMLELTESVLARNVDDVNEKMLKLVEQGIAFSLDDFGTGYSSLSYLKRLPIHQLKIDGSFVRDLQTDANDAAITQTVIDLGRSLGLEVIAEGVETAAQRNMLMLQGCRLFQGYLLGRPQTPEALEKSLANASLRRDPTRT